MKSRREAKRILRAFGKEEGKARIRYVDSFLPEKTSFIGSISYRHTLRKVAIVVLLMVLILAMTVSAYAAVMHYLNYRKIEHQDNDEYVSIDSETNQDGAYDSITFYEPTYIPEGYTLKSEEYDEVLQKRVWKYTGKESKYLDIMEYPSVVGFHIDNEGSTRSTDVVGDTEVIIYNFEDGTVGILQCDKTLIIINSCLSSSELIKIIEGLLLQ